MKAHLALALILSVLTAEGASAQRQEGEPATPRRQVLERQLNERTAELIRRRLELTDAQMTRLQATNRQFEDPRRALFARERQTRMALRQEVTNEERANQARISELLDQTIQLERQRLDLRQSEQRELAKFLTPVQRARLLGFQTELRRRAQDMRRRGPRP